MAEDKEVYDPSQDPVRARLENKGATLTQEETGAQSTPPQVQHVSVGENRIVNDAQNKAEQDAAVAGIDRNIAYYRQQLERFKQESDEDKAKREKREKAKKIIGAIGDGIRAMSNLYFTSQYAPNMEVKSSQLGTVDDRIKELKAERDKNANIYNNFMLKLGDAETERAKTLRDLAAQQEARKMAREKARQAAEEAKRNADLFPHKMRKAKGDADASEANARIKGAQAESEPDYQKGRVALQGERVKTEKARQAASYARGASYNKDKSKTFYVEGTPVVFSEGEYNNGNIAQVYKLVPDAIKRKYGKGQYGDIGIDEMSAAIGEALNTPSMTIKSGDQEKVISPASEIGSALMRLKKSGRKPNPMGENGKKASGKKSNPMN